LKATIFHKKRLGGSMLEIGRFRFKFWRLCPRKGDKMQLSNCFNATGALPVIKKLPLIFLFLFVWGCGYQFAGKDTHLPPGVTSVAIPTLVNQTVEPGIEIVFTQAFLNEFINDRRVNVVDRREADAILEGIIKSFSLASVSYNASGYALEYETIVAMDITVNLNVAEKVQK